MEWPKLDIDEYQKFVWRMNPPRVTVDNNSGEKTTVLKVDSVNRPGILLEVVQILADLELNIHKAYISSDGGWFMEVFHVTDSCGEKLTNEALINSITETIASNHVNAPSVAERVGVPCVHTVIELTGRDRPGLLSEICALVDYHQCQVAAVELWTHNTRVAGHVHLVAPDGDGMGPDPAHLARIQDSLYNVLRAGGCHTDARVARADFNAAGSVARTERRLHQLMLADRDYEVQSVIPPLISPTGLPEHQQWHAQDLITVTDCPQKGYSVVNIECGDRAKLLFDIVCTLTDLDYVIFHAITNSDGKRAYQEYYIRHRDGCTLNLEAERQRVIQCLRAAIERRVSQGLRLELCTRDCIGLLSEVTRIFREHGLSVTRAGVTMQGEKAMNVFYLTDAAGNRVEPSVVNAVRQEIGHAFLEVKEVYPTSLATFSQPCDATNSKNRFSFGNILFNLGLIRSSCS